MMNAINYIDSLKNQLFEDNIKYPFSVKVHPSIMSRPQAYRDRYKCQLSTFDFFNFKKLKIADVGGGLGIHANYFRKKGHDVVLYEPNKTYCAVAESYFPKLNIKNSYYDGDYFDIITYFSPETEIENSINLDVNFLQESCMLILVDQRATKFDKMILDIKEKVIYRYDHYTHDCPRRTLILKTKQFNPLHIFNND